MDKHEADEQEFVMVQKDDYDNDHIDEHTEDIHVNAMQEWLQPTAYFADSSDYQKHLQAHVQGTGNWLENSETYRSWLQSTSHGSLWIEAPAGMGKSVLAATTVSKLIETGVPVMFFFFRQILATNRSPHNLVRDFISQILSISPILCQQMETYLDGGRSVDGVSTDELWAHLLRALESFPRSYCIIDGLDEMDMEQGKFLNTLVKLGIHKPDSIKLLVTSRPLPRIETHLKHPSVLRLKLEREIINEDIASYVEYRLDGVEQLSASLRTEFYQRLQDKTQGSFLYARLVVDEFTNHIRRSDSPVSLDTFKWLPHSVEDMYNGMLSDHSVRSGIPEDLQLMILGYVTHSIRPLRLLELAALLHHSRPSTLISITGHNDFQTPSVKDLGDTKALVRSACGPLLEILPDETISVIHHSFTEFLLDGDRKRRSDDINHQFPVIDFKETHSALAIACLKYMNCLALWDIKPRNSMSGEPDAEHWGRVQQLRMGYPFIDYAMTHWHAHIRRLETLNDEPSFSMQSGIEQELLLHALNDFMQQKVYAWLDLNWSSADHFKKLGPTKDVLPLHVAAWSGLTSYAKHLIKNGAEVHCKDWQRMTPLAWAAVRDHNDIVALLIPHDPHENYESRPYHGREPLYFAARGNNHVIVQQLLEAGADPLSRKLRVTQRRDDRESCFYYACRAGAVESVRHMIPYLPDEYLNKALCDAVRCGKKEVVEVILASPGVSLYDSHLERSPLIIAARQGYHSIIEVLLAAGADPNKTGSNDITAIHTLFRENWREQEERSDAKARCLLVLLEAGAKVNVVDKSGVTPLHRSVSSEVFASDPVLTRLLLEYGASVTAQDKSGNTPVHNLHVRSNSAPIIDLLISHGADLQSARQSDSRTLLHLAVGDMRTQEIKPLLKHITNCNVVDSQGNTPLHLAVEALSNDCVNERIRCKAEMISDLVSSGADTNMRNNQGLTPLHFLTGKLHPDHNLADPTREVYHDLLRVHVLPVLLAGGADLDCADHDGRSLLLRTIAAQGNKAEKLVAILLDLRADINTRDYQGDNALHLLCKNGANVSLVEYFIERGANVFATNNNGNTPLHEIARAFNAVKLAELLLRRGLSPIAQNNTGQTPLHMICGTLPEWQRVDKLQDILKSELAKGLNMTDKNGAQPIHLAASISEDYVGQLVAAGVDPTAITKQGRTVLHIASLCRQSNTIGYILDIYSSLGQLDLINRQDDSGLTALHEACRSGRPETVKLLLDAGAKIDLKAKLGDIHGNSPLHACATFEQERIFWSPAGKQISPKRPLDAAGILTGDTSRPSLMLDFRQLSITGHRMFDPIAETTINTHTARVRDIVEMLIEYGADIIALNNHSLYPIDMATDLGCEEMVDVLMPHMDKVYAEEKDNQTGLSRFRRARNKFAENYLNLRGKHASGIVDREMIEGPEITTLCGQLLKLGKIEALRELPQRGVDFTPRQGETNFLQKLTSCGYPSLLRDLGRTITEPWVEGQMSPDNKRNIDPFLLTACRRTLPNLDVIKVLIETFGADVNCQPSSATSQARVLPVSTALHALAREGHWWQLKAMEYLLQCGADPELEDGVGCNVLHVALRFGRKYTRMQAVRLLLKHGANPNAIAKNGLSCLNRATRDNGLISILIQHGVDVNLGIKPAIFSAIEDQETDALALLLEAGANPNVHTSYNIENDVKVGLEHDLYPLLAAASEFFDLANFRERSTTLILLLLSKGADPYLVFDNGKVQTTIVHHLLEHGGVLQPFLEMPDLRLEQRDPQGNTLLLAACRSRFGTTDPATLNSRENQLFVKRENLAARQAEEKTTFATQLIPAHKLYDLGSNLIVQDNDGNSALHLLLSKIPSENSNFDKAVDIFIKKAPSLIHQKNKGGFKPIHIASKTTCMWPIKVLLSAGGDIHEADPDGNTILHFLAESMRFSRHDEEVISNFKYFLSLEVSIDSLNSLGETPIFWFFRCNANLKTSNTEMSLQTITDTFLEAGTDLFHKNNAGETLLHIVAGRFCGNPVPKRRSVNDMNAETDEYQKKTKIMVDDFKWLLGKGLDPMSEDLNHRTALDVAAASGNEGILELFKSSSVS